MLIPRLVFGCARLAGGVEAKASSRLLERALNAGIRHFDTAPSYGLGGAEQVVGEVIGNDPGVVVTAKVGSPRPAHPWALSTLRRGRRMLLPRKASLEAAYSPALPGDEHEPDGCFDGPFMEDSFAATLRNLRRDSVEYLLLHECYAAPPPACAVSFLEGRLGDGTARQIGIANSAVYDPRWRGASAPRWTIQAAIDPDMLLRSRNAPGSIFLHSVAKTDRWLRARDNAYAAAMAATLDAFASLGDRTALSFLVPFCLAASHVPLARLIYATSVASNLDGFLAAARAIDQGPGPAAIAAAFAGTYAAAPR